MFVAQSIFTSSKARSLSEAPMWLLFSGDEEGGGKYFPCLSDSTLNNDDDKDGIEKISFNNKRQAF